VAAGGSDLESAFGGSLTAHIGKVGFVSRYRVGQTGQVGSSRSDEVAAGEMRAGLEQGSGAAHVEALYHGGFGHVGLRQEHTAVPGRPRREGHGERTANRTQISLEADLSEDHLVPEQFLWQLTAGHQNAQRDGQVERGTVFPDVGWSQVDGDSPKREAEPRVCQGGTDPFPPFLHCPVGEADSGERRQTIGDVHFDVYRIGVDTQDGGGPDSSKHVIGKGLGKLPAGRKRPVPRSRECGPNPAATLGRCGRPTAWTRTVEFPPARRRRVVIRSGA
jgi:hypothetical protein